MYTKDDIEVRALIRVLNRADELGFSQWRRQLAELLVRYGKKIDIAGLALSRDVDLIHDCAGLLQYGNETGTFYDCWFPRYGL